MKILSEEKKLKILLALGGCVVTAIICLLIFGFDIESDRPKEKIGFIILGDIQEAGWNASHYNGIKAACDTFGVELLVRDNVKENSGQCLKAIEELVEQGAGMIFLASYAYSLEAREVIEKYSNIDFATNSSNVRMKNLTSYFARMYQGRYLAGALAGMRTKSNVIGYVAAMPNSEVNRGINAFTLGAQRVNSQAKVVVMWTNSWQDEETEAKNARRLIKERGADVLTYHQDESTVADVADSLGVDFIGYNDLLEGYSEHYLTSVICRWDLFYKDVVQRYLKDELHSINNNWLGMQQGVIILSNYSNLVTPEMRSRLNSLHKELAYDKLIFSDEIYDNQGKLRCEKDNVISDDMLLEDINWLVRGVEVFE